MTKKSLAQSIKETIDYTILIGTVVASTMTRSDDVKDRILVSDIEKGMKDLTDLLKLDWDKEDLDRYSNMDKSDIVIALANDLMGLKSAKHVMRLMNIIELALVNLETLKREGN